MTEKPKVFPMSIKLDEESKSALEFLRSQKEGFNVAQFLRLSLIEVAKEKGWKFDLK